MIINFKIFTTMFQVSAIGNIGSDAQVKMSDGNEFVTFRIAHSESWKDAEGNQHDDTQWIDCVVNGRPAVLEYLKKGVRVFVTGAARLRVYSSQKERCMKAGIQISVRQLELLGSKVDDVPAIIYDATTGAQVEVKKAYYVPNWQPLEDGGLSPFVSRSGKRFAVDSNGYVFPFDDSDEDK